MHAPPWSLSQAQLLQTSPSSEAGIHTVSVQQAAGIVSWLGHVLMLV